MKLKVDESGNAVLEAGMPVYVHDDGKEVPFDAAGAMSKIKELNAESKTRREQAEGALGKLKDFEGLDAKAAREALELAKNLKDGDLVKADKVAELKASIEKSYKDSFGAKEAQYQELIKQKESEVSAKDAAIHKLLIKGAFDSSPFLKEKTTLLPEFAFKFFSEYFTVETVNGELRAVAMLNGQPILSRSNPGEYASAEEAIEHLIDMHPQKDMLLKAPPAKGSGAAPAKGGAPGTKTWQERHKEALARGDVQGAIAIKREGMRQAAQ
jgi:hypothetical protein